MEDNKIITTDSLFKDYSDLCQFEEGSPEYLVDKEDFKEALIKFAKYHVKKALEKASEEAEVEVIEIDELTNESFYGVNKNSILKAYSEDLIK